MNYQNAEVQLEFALREQAKLRTELERAKALLGRLVQASRRTCDSGDAWLAAHDYLYPPVVKFPYANDDEGRI